MREIPDARRRAARCVIAHAPPAPRAHAAAALACDLTQSNAHDRIKRKRALGKKAAASRSRSSTQERINNALHHRHVVALRSVGALRSSCREATKVLAPYIPVCTSQTLITYVLPIHLLLQLPLHSPAPHCAYGPMATDSVGI